MRKLILIISLLTLTLLIGVLWWIGNILTAPNNQIVGNCPLELVCENIEFYSESKTTIKGWFLKGEEQKGVIILMHGVGGNRLSLVERMRFLNKNGFSVLAFDFQASGESIGNHITFGYLESFDTKAAIDFARQKLPNEKIGVIGISMGGAAYLLQKEPGEADTLILEMVYPTLNQAIKNRLNLWLFDGAEILSPLLTYQLPFRLGFSVDDLRPIDKVKDVNCPIFFIVGENDEHTTLEESRNFFETFHGQKDFWVVSKAKHTDFHKVASKEYEEKVLAFLIRNLRGEE